MRRILIITGFIVLLTLLVILSMVKFVTEMSETTETPENLTRCDDDFVRDVSIDYRLRRSGNSSSKHTHSLEVSQREVPFLVAIIAHQREGFFSCFGCVILTKWVLTAAHCKRPEQSHRVLLYSDYANNRTHTYPVVLWRVHEKFKSDAGDPKYDIAVAKIDLMGAPVLVSRAAGFTSHDIVLVKVSVWKTVYTIDKKSYLTKDLDIYYPDLTSPKACQVDYGVTMDSSLICVYLYSYKSRNEIPDSFITEFGPLFGYRSDRIIGLLTTMKPNDYRHKIAIFTNVSYYRHWILTATEFV